MITQVTTFSFQEVAAVNKSATIFNRKAQNSYQKILASVPWSEMKCHEIPPAGVGYMPLSWKDPLIHYHISHTRTIKRSWVSAKFFGEHTRQQIKVVEYPEDSMQSLLQLHQTTHTVQLSKHNILLVITVEPQYHKQPRWTGKNEIL